VSPFIYEENSVQKTGLIHTLNRAKMRTRWKWNQGEVSGRNSLRARDRNVARSHDGSKPMGFTDTYLRYDIEVFLLKYFRRGLCPAPKMCRVPPPPTKNHPAFKMKKNNIFCWSVDPTPMALWLPTTLHKIYNVLYGIKGVPKCIEISKY
jgi:hypothetical protein